MWIFSRHHKEGQPTYEARAIHEQTIKGIDKAIRATIRLNKEGGATQLLFLASGGDHRAKK